MLRTQFAAVLFLGAVMAHADDEIDKYLGEYTAVTVCDAHSVEPGMMPHILENGRFIIAKFKNEDGEDRAIIVGYDIANEKFSEYEWYGVHFVYIPGEPFPDIDMECEDSEELTLMENLAARRYTFNGQPLSADEIANLATTLENEARNEGNFDDYEHLWAEYDFHNGSKCQDNGDGDNNGQICHEIKIHIGPNGELFIEYEASAGGIHAGHVHN